MLSLSRFNWESEKHSPNNSLKRSFLGQRQYLAVEDLLKLRKNAFYVTLKALFVLKIFEVLSRLFSHVGKRLDKRTKVRFKVMMSHTDKQIITIHILPNISRKESNQVMKFGQLIFFYKYELHIKQKIQ